MLTPVEDLPEVVVGVEAHGKVTSEDYERVLVPAVEAAMARSGDGRVRLMCVVGHEFRTTRAPRRGRTRSSGLDTRGPGSASPIVGDADWLRHAVHSWLMPGEITVPPSRSSTGLARG